MKILVIRLSSIGDIILTTPVVRALRRKYHGATIDFLVSKVREALGRSITNLFAAPDGQLHVVSLHPEVEGAFMRAGRDSEQGGGVALDPSFTQEFLARLEDVLRAAYSAGPPPVLLVPTPIRLFVKRLVEPTYPNLAVMGYSEVSPSAQVQAAGTVVVHDVRNEQHAAG